MKKDLAIALSLAASLALVGCGGSASAPADDSAASGDAPAAEEAAESSSGEADASSDEEVSTWVDAIDWSKYQKQDNPFEFGPQHTEAPLTLDVLYSMASEMALESVDENGEPIIGEDGYRENPQYDIEEFAESTAKPDTGSNTDPTFTMSYLVIDGESYTLGFYDTTYQKSYKDLYADNQFSLEGGNVYQAMGLADVEDPEDGRGEAYLVDALLDKYGMPSWIESMEGGGLTTIFWEREGYKFGVYIEDLSYVWNEANFSPKQFSYYSDAAWGGYVETVTSDTKYPRTVVPFEEFLAAHGK